MANKKYGGMDSSKDLFRSIKEVKEYLLKKKRIRGIYIISIEKNDINVHGGDIDNSSVVININSSVVININNTNTQTEIDKSIQKIENYKIIGEDKRAELISKVKENEAETQDDPPNISKLKRLKKYLRKNAHRLYPLISEIIKKLISICIGGD